LFRIVSFEALPADFTKVHFFLLSFAKLLID